MAINEYYIVDIKDYYINDFWWIFYCAYYWLLLIIILMTFDEYSSVHISGY
jgi:hypothetical protein